VTTASPAKRDAAIAAALFAILTIVWTWPVAFHLTRKLPGDLGDPLLNTWILAWDATHFGRGWWNANIFYPHPLALAYSEHLAAQAAQALPLYWATGNAILCYNVIFLSTFVLSGLGMFLLARELTGSREAAFVAGLAYAFAPYRVASLPHIQVLSSAWMPFVLFGFRRFFETGRRRSLAGAAAAWILQNLSCGYYLLFFSPFAALYLAWELTTRRLWRSAKTMVLLVTVLTIVALGTLPFLLPYLALRGLGFNPRSLVETRNFSADVLGYLTADVNVRVWGSIVRAWPKAEGALFPGFTVASLAAIASFGSLWRDERRRRSTAILDAAVVVVAAVIAALLFGWTIRLPILKITSLSRALVIAAAAGTVLLAGSRGYRARAAAWVASPAGAFALLTLFAVAMSFGPDIRARDRVVLDPNVYAFFYRFVPGFVGLRVPARYGMLVALGLSVLAAFGLSSLAVRQRSVGARRAMIAAAALAVLVESFAAPLPMSQNDTGYRRPNLAALPDLSADPPPVYDYVATLAPGTAIVELPLGEPAFDVRYMYYSTRHWRPLVNGYTGGQPADYELLDRMLQDLFTRPDRAWSALSASAASHAIVHESYYAAERGRRVSEWLQQNGAKEVASFGPDRVFELPAGTTRRLY
jgi:hypothetical protein